MVLSRRVNRDESELYIREGSALTIMCMCSILFWFSLADKTTGGQGP